MLEWQGPDENGMLRASDEYALYVISLEGTGHYRVGFFPAPGPECLWGGSLSTVAEAKVAAEDCVRHVREIRESCAGRVGD